MEFVDVFNNRTSGCRYAVVEPVGTYAAIWLRGGYWLIDLYDARIPANPNLHGHHDIRLGNYQVFPTEAAAIMAGVLSCE